MNKTAELKCYCGATLIFCQGVRSQVVTCVCGETWGQGLPQTVIPAAPIYDQAFPPYYCPYDPDDWRITCHRQGLTVI